MTKFPTGWAGAHRGSPSTEGADVLRTVGAYMVWRLALETLYDGRIGQFGGVRDNDGIVGGSGLHNHL